MHRLELGLYVISPLCEDAISEVSVSNAIHKRGRSKERYNIVGGIAGAFIFAHRH